MNKLGRSLVVAYLQRKKPGAELTSYHVATDEQTGERYATIFYRERGKPTLTTAAYKEILAGGTRRWVQS